MDFNLIDCDYGKRTHLNITNINSNKSIKIKFKPNYNNNEYELKPNERKLFIKITSKPYQVWRFF